MSEKEQDRIDDSLYFSLDEIVDAFNLINQIEDYRNKNNFYKREVIFDNNSSNTFELKEKKYPLPIKNGDGTFKTQNVQYGWDGQKLFTKDKDPNFIVRLAKKLPWKEMSNGGCYFHR